MKNNLVLKTFVLTTLLLGSSLGLAGGLSINNNFQEVSAYTNGDGATYYNNIDDTKAGDGLLSQLRSLNNNKRQKTVGFSNMWSYYDQTDYFESNSSLYTAFYQGTSATRNEMNKEHVWPDSRGGNLVENDIHMPRPTLNADNNSRGNSFYVEGMNSQTAGWDPKADGMNETYRGDSARIIFYCVVANNQLKLVDKSVDDKNNKTMGKLSDLLKWNLNYPVLQREKNRNEGAESIQGNRNPFIDHPEYACKIWGDVNDATRAICAGKYTPGAGDPAGLSGDTSEEDTPISTPNISRLYKLGTYQKGLQTQYYATGNVANSYYGETTSNKDEAADVNLISSGNGYYLKMTKTDNSVVYLNGTVNASNKSSITFDSTPTTIWEFDATYLTLKANFDSKYWFLNSYNSYQTLALSDFSYVTSSTTYPAHLYQADDDDDIVIIEDETLTISGTLQKTVYELDEFFDPTGLKVSYFNGYSSKDVTDKVEWSHVLLDTPGQIEISCRYLNFVAVYGNITVNDVNIPPSIPPTSDDKPSTPGCKASVSGSSSIIFIIAAFCLVFAIKFALKSKKEN